MLRAAPNLYARLATGFAASPRWAHGFLRKPDAIALRLIQQMPKLFFPNSLARDCVAKTSLISAI
jgi:hypothetical protein